MASWPLRRWVVAVAAAAVTALLTGVPTGIIETSLYTRMTPVLWWNYPVWALSAVLAGLIAATYVRLPDTETSAPDRSRRTAVATLGSAFAIGCPICNKLIVAAIGVSGALNVWAPIQPVLGVLSIAVLLLGLVVRLRGEVRCPMPAAALT